MVTSPPPHVEIHGQPSEEHKGYFKDNKRNYFLVAVHKCALCQGDFLLDPDSPPVRAFNESQNVLKQTSSVRVSLRSK